MITLSFFSLIAGNVDVKLKDLIALDQDAWHIILISRIPRTVAIILTGIGLSISGLVMQKLVQNRFVTPSTAGTQDFARLGIMMSLVYFNRFSVIERTLFAFIYSLIGTALFMILLKKIRLKNIILVPLLGMMLGSVVNSFTSFLALKYDASQVLSTYLTGSFTLTIQGNYELMYLLIPTVYLIFRYASVFNIIALGEDLSTSLGVSYKKVVSLGIVLVSIINAIIITTIGTIPYVGLIVPNLVSIIVGDELNNALRTTALLGAVLILIVDLAARLIIAPYEIPIVILFGIIGSIVFIYLIWRNANDYN